MTAAVVALAAAYGVHLLYTAVALGWRGVAPGPPPEPVRQRGLSAPRAWLAQAGLGDVSVAEFAAAVAVLAVVGGAAAFALFGGVVVPVATAALCGSLPVTAYRARRTRLRAEAQEAWPRMIEELRVQTGSLGRSIPQALFDVGARGPEELRPAFAAARREWLLSTDFARSLTVLKDRLADPTADAACETLLIAHEVGGTDLDRRLEALAEDRLTDVHGRKDARAKQAGVRFARRFVLIVPAGMALAGLSIGNGRAAYATAQGQLAVMGALAVIAACWLWAGRLLALPDEERVFDV